MPINSSKWRVFVEKMTANELVKNSGLFVHVISLMNPVHAVPPNCFEIHFNIILSTPRLYAFLILATCAICFVQLIPIYQHKEA